METSDGDSSLLARLRAVLPGAHGEPALTRRRAEVQALLLLRATGAHHAPVSDNIIRDLSRIKVVEADIPTSGLTHWDGAQWVITLNRYEPQTRRRFTLLHEYKHIIDHPHMNVLYRDLPGKTADQQMEAAADYFAGCVLVPHWLLKQAWRRGERSPERLARMFNVSVPAINVRLMQVGLSARLPRGPAPTSFDSFPTQTEGSAA